MKHTGKCSVDGCEKPAAKRGMCDTHYRRWCRGTPLDTPLRKWGTFDERLWKSVDQDGPISSWKPGLDACWIWNGHRTTAGYGSIWRDGKLVYVHRAMYEAYYGEIEDGLVLDHLCHIRACCNPAHLEAVTQAVNAARGLTATKTHCKHGHEFTPENTRFESDGRRCRQCHRDRERERSKRKKETASSVHDLY